MTKKRGHRAPTRPNRNDRSVQRPQAGDATSRGHIRISVFFYLLFLFIPIVSVAVFRFKFPPSHTDTDTDTHTILSVYERGLVKPKIGFQEILAENSKPSENTSRRHFLNPVLAYVTPWNSGGYDMAKRFTSKFTHLSPVWYDLKSEGSELVLEGLHNVDIEWITALRANGNALVVPRVVLEAFPNQLLRKKQQWKKAIDLIIKECKEMGYDGIVLESWSRWAAYGVLHDPDMRRMVSVSFDEFS